MESVTATAFPTFVHMVFFVAFIDRDEADSDSPQAVLEVTVDGGAPIFTTPVAVTFPPGLARLRVAVRIAGLVVPRPGRMRFALKLGGSGVVAEQSLQVVLAPPIVQAAQATMPFMFRNG
ncbi:MAG TPA: hypothetical protein VK841_22670 [Polyangiaceae bacterium]|nr:hypothetical protein [Polyangiaceae bacterium]